MSRAMGFKVGLFGLCGLAGLGCQPEMDVSEFAVSAAESHIKQMDEALTRAADTAYFLDLVEAYDDDKDRDDPDFDDGEWQFEDEITQTRYRFESSDGDAQEDPDEETDRIEIELDIDTKTLPLFPTDRTQTSIESRAKNLTDDNPEVKVSFLSSSEFLADVSEVVTNGEGFADMDLNDDHCPDGEFSGTVSARGKSPLEAPGHFAVDYLVWYDDGQMNFQIFEGGQRLFAEGSRDSLCK